MVSFGKVLPGESNFAKACEVYGSALVKVLPGESNFAKACEVYGSALAKFILSMLNLPKLVELMTQLGKPGCLPGLQ